MAKTIEGGGSSGGGSSAAAKLISTVHPNHKVKLMCSYGGKIQPRPQNQQLVYIGGDTKLLTVDRNAKFSDVVAKLSALYNITSDEVSIKYQFPGEDLDVLISLINDDDLENMMFEYDRLINSPSSKPARFRLFLSKINSNPAKPNSDDNGSDGPFNPDYLFGFDKEYDYGGNKSNRKNTLPTAPPSFDLGLWTIPSTVGSVRNGGDENMKDNDGKTKAGTQLIHSTEYAGGCGAGAGTAAQLIYWVPPPAVGSGFPGCGGGSAQYRMVPVPMGVVNGFGESSVYNVVPSVVPEQMKIPATSIDRVSQKRNV